MLSSRRKLTARHSATTSKPWLGVVTRMQGYASQTRRRCPTTQSMSGISSLTYRPRGRATACPYAGSRGVKSLSGSVTRVIVWSVGSDAPSSPRRRVLCRHGAEGEKEGRCRQRRPGGRRGLGTSGQNGVEHNPSGKELISQIFPLAEILVALGAARPAALGCRHFWVVPV